VPTQEIGPVGTGQTIHFPEIWVLVESEWASRFRGRTGEQPYWEPLNLFTCPTSIAKTIMRRGPILLFALTITAFAAAPYFALRAGTPQGGHSVNDPPLSAAEQHSLIERIFANQHADDQALPLFERVEHEQAHGREGDPSTVEDKVVRIVPMGVGLARITLQDHGHALDAAAILQEESFVEHQLEIAADANNPQTKRDREKADHRAHDRAELINAAHDAFTYTWDGRELRNGKVYAKFRLTANPSYKSTSRYADMMTHAVATIWVDEAAAQVSHVEADLTSDITIGGGIVAKVYKGGKVVMDQYEVEPGVWEPTFAQYDFAGRKFLFSLEIHERTETSKYKRIGSPDQALVVIRRELSSGTM
jgi:hypothetical protein